MDASPPVDGVRSVAGQVRFRVMAVINGDPVIRGTLGSLEPFSSPAATCGEGSRRRRSRKAPGGRSGQKGGRRNPDLDLALQPGAGQLPLHLVDRVEVVLLGEEAVSPAEDAPRNGQGLPFFVHQAEVALPGRIFPAQPCLKLPFPGRGGTLA